MTNKEYANLLINDNINDWEYYEDFYKERNLGSDAIVSRFAPSPTGFIHMGSLLAGLTAVWYANQTNGKAFLRIEDTDQKRLVENGIEGIINDFEELNVKFDEDPRKNGNYGPYVQSERKDIYKAFAKKLIELDRAYPCFCSQDDINSIRNSQEEKKQRLGYYGKYAKCRSLSKEEVIKNINEGKSFILRLKSPGSFYNKVELNDLIRGKIELPENDIDEVIIKSDGLPTYHFAHVVDDHIMRVTHVIRGDEWVSSYPKHDQLFKALEFDLPNFAHVSPINIKDGETVRKISKRKDAWAAISFYNEKGIPHEVIKLYLATLTNSNFEEWYNNNIDKTIKDFTFAFDKMPITGPLFDLEKLINISKTYFSRLTAEEVYEGLLNYTSKYDREFNDLITKDKNYVINMLNIERTIAKPRKDISAYEDIKNIYWFMFDELFSENKDDYEEVNNINQKELIDYLENVYNENDSQEDWFNNLANYAESIGFTKDRKAFKENPENYKGMIADFCKYLRIMITKKNLSPNLYDILKLLGKEKLISKVNIFYNK